MALDVATGLLTIFTGAAGTTYSVTGLTFQPKIVLFFWTGVPNAAGTAERDIRGGFGAAISATNRRCSGWQSDYGHTTPPSDSFYRIDACIATLSITGAIDGLVDFQSMNADGFTVVVDDALPTTLDVSYVALGGSDLTDYEIGGFTVPSPAATGTVNYATAGGFKPDCLLFFPTILVVDNAVTAGGHCNVGVAAGVGVDDQATLATHTTDAIGTSDTYGYCLPGEAVAVTTGSGGPLLRAALSALYEGPSPAPGWQLNYIEHGVTAVKVWYVALKGGSYKVKNFLTRTTIGNIVETGVGFQPKGVFLASACRAVSTANVATAHMEASFGAVVGAGGSCQSFMDKDAATTCDAASARATTLAYINLSSAATIGIEGTIEGTSLDADGFTLNQNDADPTANFMFYLAMGDTVVTGPQTFPQTLASSITPGGALARRVGKFVDAGLTPTAVVVRRVGKPLAGGLTPAAALATTKVTRVTLTSSTQPGGALARHVAKLLASGLTPAAGLVRGVRKFLTGGVTPGATLAALKLTLVSLASSLTPAALLTKRANKPLAGGVTPSALKLARVTKSFTSGLTPTATMTQRKVFLKDFSSGQTSSAVLTRRAQLILAGAVTPVDTLGRRVDKKVAGGVTPVAGLLASKLAFRTLSGNVSPTATVTRRVGKALAGQVSAIAGSLGKQVRKGLAATVGSSATLVAARVYIKALSASLQPGGELRNRVWKALGSTMTPEGVLTRRVGKVGLLAAPVVNAGLNFLAFIAGAVEFLFDLFTVIPAVEARTKLGPAVDAQTEVASKIDARTGITSRVDAQTATEIEL